MCGIVGFIGRQNAALILLDGLKKLEYTAKKKDCDSDKAKSVTVE